jgi:hypothetical protein
MKKNDVFLGMVSVLLAIGLLGCRSGPSAQTEAVAGAKSQTQQKQGEKDGKTGFFQVKKKKNRKKSIFYCIGSL